MSSRASSIRHWVQALFFFLCSGAVDAQLHAQTLTNWVPVGSAYYSQFPGASPFVYLTFSNNFASSAFATQYPQASGGWNLRWFLDMALEPNTGKPFNCAVSDVTNWGGVAVFARIKLSELTLPVGARPSYVELKIEYRPPVSSGGSTTYLGVSAALWKNVRLIHYSPTSGQTLHEYRPCIIDPPLGPHGEWGSDGSGTWCPSHGLTGQNQFPFTALPILIKTPIGNPSGVVVGPIDATLIQTIGGDSLRVTLDGAPAGSSAWLFAGTVEAIPPLGLVWQGVTYPLYVSNFTVFGPFLVDSSSHVETLTVPVNVSLDQIPIYVQWFALSPAPGSSAGVSAAMRFQIDYLCSG